MQETQVQSLGWEDSLEKEMATHSSVLAWRIPWTEETGGLWSPWAPKVLDMTKWQQQQQLLLPLPGITGVFLSSLHPRTSWVFPLPVSKARVGSSWIFIPQFSWL